MPNYKTHDAITVGAAAAGGLVLHHLYGDGVLVVTVVAGVLVGGCLLSPDLDTASRPYFRWGWFRGVWYPYQALMPHRSPWSHGVVRGTVLRLVYLAGVVLLLLTVGHWVGLTPPASAAIGMVRGWWDNHQTLVVAALLGVAFGSALHTLADWAATPPARRRRPQRPRQRYSRRTP